MWDPWMMDYTWLPYDGIFMDPFGFGFYSPWYLYGGGFIYPGYGFRGGYYGGYWIPRRLRSPWASIAAEPQQRVAALAAPEASVAAALAAAASTAAEAAADANWR